MLTFLKKQKPENRQSDGGEPEPLSVRLAEAVEQLKASNQSGQRLLCYYPGSRTNPFQQILYQAAAKNQYEAVDTESIRELRLYLEGVDLMRLPPVDVHIHWIHAFIRGATSAVSAEEMAENAIADLTALKGLGCRVIWTIHNIISHNPSFLDVELTMRQRVAQLADHIHLMNPETISLCAPYYQINAEKCLYIPHPSYADVYENTVASSTARQKLGLGDDDHVILFFGNLAEFKGIRDLIKVHQDLLKDRKNLVLQIAGRAKDLEYLDTLKRVSAQPQVRLYNQLIPDDELQTHFKAADVVVCPYGRSLNSGVALAALTFERSLVVPNPLAHSFVGLSNVYSFEPGELSSLKAAIARSLDKAVQDCETEHFLKARMGMKISNDLFAALRAALAQNEAA